MNFSPEQQQQQQPSEGIALALQVKQISPATGDCIFKVSDFVSFLSDTVILDVPAKEAYLYPEGGIHKGLMDVDYQFALKSGALVPLFGIRLIKMHQFIYSMTKGNINSNCNSGSTSNFLHRI